MFIDTRWYNREPSAPVRRNERIQRRPPAVSRTQPAPAVKPFHEYLEEQGVAPISGKEAGNGRDSHSRAAADRRPRSPGEPRGR